MICATAICPPAPLLARELTGRDPVIPELRQACAAAVARLVRSGSEVIAVAGTAPRTAAWPATGHLNLSAFAPAAVRRAEPGSGPALPLPLGLGARLLDQAGYQGPRVLQSVGHDEPAEDCLRLGAEIACLSHRVALLVMADGSACRSPRAPGHLDPRSAAFDAEVERAVRSGNLGALRAVDRALARELLATGWPAWQVLAGAMPGPALATEILYAGDPFGVAYLVAWLSGEPAGDSTAGLIRRLTP